MLLLFCLLLISAVQGQNYCNTSLYYVWRNTKYLGYLSTDPNFWRYQTQTQFVLTKGLALDLAVAKCKDKFSILYRYKAGRSGPINIQSAYKSMCSDVCLESDRLSQEALKFSQCSCLELSTQPGDPFYHFPGDWCKHNSARLLCDVIGYCGVWECRIDDFMCPRYEWNKKIIPLKGPGTCVRNSATKVMISYIFVALLVSSAILFMW